MTIPGTKISNYTDGGIHQPTDNFVVARSGANRKIAGSAVIGYQKSEIASSATPSPAGDAARNLLIITALAEAAEFSAPSGTAVDGNLLMIRVKDNATGRALTYNAIYRAMQNSLPATTTASKWLRMLFEYNAGDVKWDLIGVDEEG
jgi:hypothetical protein